MLQGPAIIALLLVGWCLWERRLSWRSLPADRVATMGIFLAGIGLTLFHEVHLMVAIRAVTGIPYFEHYLGHMFLLSATGCEIYAAGCRLVPDHMVGSLMRRMDIPATAGAFIMFVCIACSYSTRRYPATDFLASVPLGPWLQTYWLTWSVTGIYMLGFLMRLMLVLRHDPRSRHTANLFIVMCTVGIGALVLRIITVVTEREVDPRGEVYRLLIRLCVAIGTMAVTLSWRARIRPFRRLQRGLARQLV